MHVTLCVDALEPQFGGIGRYTWELCKGLREDPAVLPAFYAHNRLIDDPACLLRSNPKGCPGPLIRRYRKWQARRTLRKTLVHGPNYFLPKDAEAGIVTVHDLSVFHYPDLHPAARVRDFERHLRRSIDKAEHLITDCESIRGEVIDFASVPPERVTAIPLGVSERFQPVPLKLRRSVLRQYGLPEKGYGLALSTLEPRKRIDHLLSAWKQLPRPIRDRFPLVIGGTGGWNNEQLHAQIQAGADEGWAIPLGFVAEADLPAIYSGATLFGYPSVYEGFGLPPLEAMATGTPAIVAENSCLAEVTRGAALLVDPDDIEALRNAIVRALSDNEWRSGAISAGIKVARGYTWPQCVNKTIAIYQQVNSRIGDEGR